MYDYLSKDDEEDKEMEPAPVGGHNIVREIITKMNNEERQAQNENRKRARAGRRNKRKKRQLMTEAKKAIEETKEAISEERTTQRRRSPRLNPSKTVGSAYISKNLRADMHSAQAVTNRGQEQPRQPYEPLPSMQSP